MRCLPWRDGNAWGKDEGEEDVAIATAQGKSSVVIHKVAAGESLASIAQRVWCDPGGDKEQ